MVARYEAGKIGTLGDRSHRPRRVPHQMQAELEARVLELRRQRPHWGPISVPSHMAIYRALVRHDLIEDQSNDLKAVGRCAARLATVDHPTRSQFK